MEFTFKRGALVNLWAREQKLLRNISKSKPHTSIESTRVQISHLEMRLDFTDQFFTILKQLVNFSN